MRPFSDVGSAAKNSELPYGILRPNDLENDVTHEVSVKHLASMCLDGVTPPKWSNDNDGRSVEVKKEYPDLLGEVDLEKESVPKEHIGDVPVLLVRTGNIVNGSSFNAFASASEDNSGLQKSQIRQLHMVRSWFARRYSSCPRSSGEILGTLLRLAEDRIYIYGFDKRREREEILEEQRVARRKRGKAWEEAYNAKRRNTGIGSTTLSSFSFMRWNNVKLNNTNSLEHILQPVEASSILSNDEKQMFSRYASSSGKLRKECADPYQFLTNRLVEMRHRIETEISDESKTKGSKEAAFDSR